jgi:hypothetical protein
MRVDASDDEAPEDTQEAPSSPPEPEQPESEEPGESPPPPSPPSEREKELERQLRRQGSELAQTRQAAAALGSQLKELHGVVTTLAANQSEAAKQEAARREREREAYLQTLPADQRAIQEIKLLKEEVRTLRQPRTDVPPARTQQPPPVQETPQQYMQRRMREIVNEANQEFEVTLDRADLQGIPEDAWYDEGAFYGAVMRQAARKQVAANGQEGDVAKPKPKKDETPDEMRARIKQEVRDEMGVGSGASPRAAATRRGKPPTETDVRKAVETYDSRRGPKANVQRLREMRDKMG